MFIQTEATPNPATLKFLPGRAVLERGTLDMPSKEAATQSPIPPRELNGAAPCESQLDNDRAAVLIGWPGPGHQTRRFEAVYQVGGTAGAELQDACELYGPQRLVLP